VAAAGPSSATLSDLVPSQASVAPIGQWSPEALLRLVREQAAEVLGHRDSSELDVERAFRDLGFDSVTVVDLRRRLTQATGVKLSVASMFDHPSASAVALQLAREKGNAPWMHKTRWPEGWLPIDTYKKTVDEIAS